jgi:predicted transcriptional regulator
VGSLSMTRRGDVLREVMLATGTTLDPNQRRSFLVAAQVPPPTTSPRSVFRHTILSMVSEDQIQQWVDEAEAGYDVEEMKRRGRGRPGRGAEPMQVVAVRLTADELAAVDVIAEREHISRSEAIRRALADFAA